jgi:hypothetical protein
MLVPLDVPENKSKALKSIKSSKSQLFINSKKIQQYRLFYFGN